MVVALVIRVDANGSIRHYGFRTGGRDDDILVRGLSLIADKISQVIELALCLLVDYFLVADCGLSYRIPVDHSHASVNHSFLVEVHEGVDNGFAKFRLHGEACAVPVAGCSQLPELLEYDSAVLFLPFPGFFQELLPCKGRFLYPPFLEPCHNLCFCCYGSVVSAGNPAGVFACHAGSSDQDILDGVVHHVTHVKHSGDVWRRYHNRIRFPFIGFRVEYLVL